MGTLNVNRKVTDLYYRYKMPRICAKVEGKGNGIKTVIVNMSDVAKSLNRPATYPTKYFGCELGAQIQFDYKNDRFIVNGAHDSTKLQDLLDGFIQKYVLCPACDNPETDLLINKKEDISQACKACGHHGIIVSQHRLNTFIVKNPPNVNPAAQGASLTEKNKRSKRSKKGDNDTSTTNGGADQSTNGSADVSKLSTNGDEDDDDDANWTVDVSEEAVRARMQDLTDGAKNITISEDTEKSDKERIDIFYEFVKARIERIDNVQTHKEIHNEAVRLEVIQKSPLVLVELLFSANIIADAKKHRNLLLRFTHNDTKAQKYLLGGIENILALHTSLIEKTAGIFKLFYDLDLLEEKVLLEWGQKVSKKYVSKDIAQQIHDKASPFIKWLQEAEEEESESEEDAEIEFDDRVKGDSLKANMKPAAVPVKKTVDDDDDGELNIDDI